MNLPKLGYELSHDPWQPEKFTGPAWYQFESMGVPHHRYVLWAEADWRIKYGLVRLSDGPDQPVKLWLSGKVFDETCTGKWLTIDEVDRMHGLGRYEERRS